MNIFFFIRNCITDANINRTSHINSGLTSEGRLQASAIAQRMRNFNTKLIPCVWSGEWRSVKETAQIAAKELDKEITISSAFNHLDIGDWKDLTLREIEQRYESEWKEFTSYPNPGKIIIPGGTETINDMTERSYSEVIKLSESYIDNHICIFTHGIVIRALTCQFLGLELSKLWTFESDNAAISCFSFENKKIKVEFLNDTGYLSNYGNENKQYRYVK